MKGIAVIGLGYWGPQIARNLHQIGDVLRMCCDSDAVQATAMGRAFPSLQIVTNVEDVFASDQIDAVVLATPARTHYDLASRALQAGKSVLIEKPMAETSEQAQELVDLAHRLGLVLMVDHVYVFSPAVQKMKELLDAGELGQVMFTDSVRINLGLFRHDVNVVWDLAPHDLSILDYLLGRLPKSVSTFGSAHSGLELEDVAYLHLDFGQGLIANIHVNWLSPVKIRHLMIGGTKKSLIFNDLDLQEPVKVYSRGVTVRSDNVEDRRRVLIDYRTGDVWSPHIPRTEPLRKVAEHFVDCVRNGRTPLTDGACGLRVVRILEAAQRSLPAYGEHIKL